MDLSRRSTAPEWMDDPAADPAELRACLADLARVNTVTLARPPTLGFFRRVAHRLPPGATLSVLDVGFGDGDMLRRIARWGARRGLKLRLEGIDLLPASAEAARAATPPDLPIRYRVGDVFAEEPGSWDVVISSLVAHHLSAPELVRFLRWMEAAARLGWFVNDLQRHRVALHGFTVLSAVAGWHPMVRHDGRVSVSRSFRRGDWARLLHDSGLERVAQVRWRLPFRLCVTRIR